MALPIFFHIAGDLRAIHPSIHPSIRPSIHPIHPPIHPIHSPILSAVVERPIVRWDNTGAVRRLAARRRQGIRCDWRVLLGYRRCAAAVSTVRVTHLLVPMCMECGLGRNAVRCPNGRRQASRRHRTAPHCFAKPLQHFALSTFCVMLPIVLFLMTLCETNKRVDFVNRATANSVSTDDVVFCA